MISVLETLGNENFEQSTQLLRLVTNEAVEQFVDVVSGVSSDVEAITGEASLLPDELNPDEVRFLGSKVFEKGAYGAPLDYHGYTEKPSRQNLRAGRKLERTSLEWLQNNADSITAASALEVANEHQTLAAKIGSRLKINQ